MKYNLYINIEKRKIATYQLQKITSTLFNYSVNGTTPVWVENAMDLGIIFYNKLSVTEHLTAKCRR